MRKYILFVSSFLLTTLSYTQTENCNNYLIGTVMDTHDQTILVGATIQLIDEGIAVISDLNGEFKLENLCEKNYSLQISHPSCDTKVFNISIRDNTERSFKLEHHLEELNEVIILGNAFSTKTESMLENRLTEIELEKFSSGSLGDALDELSGVSSLKTGNSVVKPVINGLHSSRVTVINNGVRMQDQEWGAEHAPTLDVNSASSITVIKGASALQFTGDAIGGIVISEPIKVPIKDTIFGKSVFSFATNGRGGSNTTSIVKGFKNGLYGQVQGTIKRFGDFETPDYILSNTGFFERDMMLRIGQNKLDWGWEAQYSYFRNEIAILRASHLGGAEDQVNAINSERPLIIEDFTYHLGRPRQDVEHQIARASVFRRFVNLGKVQLSYDFQSNRRFEFDNRRGDDADKASVDLKLNTHNINASLESNFNRLDLKTGLNLNYQNNFANPATGVRRLIPDYDQYRAGIYAIANYNVSDNLLIEAGARYDYQFMDVFKYYRTSFWESRGYDEDFSDIVVEEFGNQILTNPELKFNNFSATLGANYELQDNLLLYANLSFAKRAPNASELFSEGLHHSASRIELGDLRFDSEDSKKISLTLQKKGDFSFSINPYYNVLDNFIIIEPTGVEQTLRGNFQVWEYRQVPAEMIGLDLNLIYSLSSNLNISSAFSIVKAYERNSEEPLINIPPASILNALNYKKGRLSAYIKHNYIFSQNEFPNTNFEVFLPESETTELVDVSTPPKAYQLLDIGGSYKFPFIKHSEMEIGLQIQNVFDTAYRNYLNRLRYYADDLGRNIIFNTKINF